VPDLVGLMCQTWRGDVPNLEGSARKFGELGMPLTTPLDARWLRRLDMSRAPAKLGTMNAAKELGRTMRTAHKLKAAGAGEMAMPVELIDIRLPRGDQELSLVARRSLLLMLEAAAGNAWRHEFHQILKRELRGKHAALEHVRAAFGELMGVWFATPDTLEGKASTRRFHLIDEITDQNDNIASAILEFRFSRRACQLLQRSDVYARLSREAIVKFRSSYALRIYEIGSMLYSRRDPTWRGNVKELRKLLHVPDGVYLNFAQLRRRVLEPARDEIGHLAEFDMSWQEKRKGRQVIAVELVFAAKPGRRAFAAAEENKRHSAGRRARQDGSAETVVGLVKRTGKLLSADISWPADDAVGPYSAGELYKIGVECGGGHAVDRIARAYVEHMGGKRHELVGNRLRSSWQGFCEAKAKQWGAV
jgi:hypothetical protein